MALFNFSRAPALVEPGPSETAHEPGPREILRVGQLPKSVVDGLRGVTVRDCHAHLDSLLED